VRSLSSATAGLVGPRDPAQPLLTLLHADGRVELSGATTANWVAKSANLLVDGYGAPARVGLLLPLHWQSVCLLLAGVATGATVVVADSLDGLAGSDLAFTSPSDAEAALDAGVTDVLALSVHPLGLPAGDLPPGVDDYAREVPSYGDHWNGAAPAGVDVVVGGAPLGPLPELALGGDDRVLVASGLAASEELRRLLAVLRTGAALVLVPDVAAIDLARAADDERVTAVAGLDLGALPRLG
jgi:uncharacterized protein (TIGR03089 family)